VAVDAVVRFPRYPLRLGLARNAVLEREAKVWLHQVQTAYEIDGQSHRVYDTLSSAAKSWDRPRRVIVKAEHLRDPGGGKSNPRSVVTNYTGDPQGDRT